MKPSDVLIEAKRAHLLTPWERTITLFVWRSWPSIPADSKCKTIESAMSYVRLAIRQLRYAKTMTEWRRKDRTFPKIQKVFTRAIALAEADERKEQDNAND